MRYNDYLSELQARHAARPLSADDFEREDIRGLLEALRNGAGSRDTPTRLEVLAAIERIAAHTTVPREALQSVFEALVPARMDCDDLDLSTIMPAAQDRLYVANCLATFQQPWILRQAAREIVQESANKAREVWVGVLFSRSPTLRSALEPVVDALPTALGDVGASVDSRYRRLRDVTAALAPAITTADIASGENAAAQIFRLYARTGPQVGPKDKTLRLELARDWMRQLREIVRLNRTVSLQPELYKIPHAIGRWWGAASLPRELNDDFLRLTRSGLDVLYDQLRAGNANVQLRTALRSGLGSDRVRRQTQSLLDDDRALTTRHLPSRTHPLRQFPLSPGPRPFCVSISAHHSARPQSWMPTGT